MEGRTLAHAGQRLAVLALRLASDGVLDPRLRHQVPFIRTVGEDASVESGPVFRDDRRHGRPRLLDARFLAQPMAHKYTYSGLLEHLTEHLFSHLRLVKPSHVL